jgi:flavin reductase (DIM6/NTAB) family NADH-FMN oxidoreductase RutF
VSLGDEQSLKDAFASFATGVAILTVRDGMDDIGGTMSAIIPLSLSDSLVGVSVTTTSYLGEVLARRDLWGLSVLRREQRSLAGRFAASGRPSARILLDDTPCTRGPQTEALLLTHGLSAWECRTVQRVPAGDHTLLIAEVLEVVGVSRDADPLLRFHRAYRTLTP